MIDDNVKPWRYKGQMYRSDAATRARMFELKGQAEAQAAYFAQAVASGQAEPWVHRFEQAGLGKAPFNCVGMEVKAHVACQGAPVQPGGTCDYCGQAILYVFHCISRDGKRFHVGSDCVARVGDEGLKRDLDRQPEWRRLKREKAQAAKARRDARVLEALKALLADKDALAALAEQPHPQGFVDRETGEPLTALDWAWWMMDHCGAAGREGLLKGLKKRLGR